MTWPTYQVQANGTLKVDVGMVDLANKAIPFSLRRARPRIGGSEMRDETDLLRASDFRGLVRIVGGDGKSELEVSALIHAFNRERGPGSQ